jgi:hypothetical protein
MLKRVALSFAVLTAIISPRPAVAWDGYERPCYPRLVSACLRPVYASCVRCAPVYSRPRAEYPRYAEHLSYAEPRGYYPYSRDDWDRFE